MGQLTPQQRIELTVREGIAGLSNELTPSHLVFAVLRVARWSQKTAYKAVNPGVKDESAGVTGCRWDRTTAPVQAALRANPALMERCLADAGRLRVLVSAQASHKDILTAADQTYKLRGDYKDQPVVQVNVAGILEGRNEPESAPVLDLDPQDVVVESSEEE